MPFDPAVEFAGIQVQAEPPEMFRVNLPDQSMTLVAPGETTPKKTNVHGVNVEGTQLRYIRMSQDLNEVQGLGLTQISGIASFSEPATCRLRRMSDESIQGTTDTGISLSTQWLHGEAHRIEALTLDHQWVDITDQCPIGSIPTQVVKEWSERNQRTLVTFRMTR